MERSEYSEEMARKIDNQVRAIATEAFTKARTIIRENRDLVDRLVDLLVDNETIEGEQFRQIVTEYMQEKEQKLSVV